MDKSAALKAATAVAVIFLLLGLVHFALVGYIWADVVLAVILVILVGYGFYEAFKD